MSGRDSSTVFNGVGFHQAVTEYMSRWQTSQKVFAAQVGVAPRVIKEFCQGIRAPTLYLVCKLAYACDLSLDKYVLAEVLQEEQSISVIDWRDHNRVTTDQKAS